MALSNNGNLDVSIEYLRQNILRVASSIIWKNKTVADSYEDSSNAYLTELYMAAHRDVLSFSIVASFPVEILRNIGITSEQELSKCCADKRLIPAALRDQAVSEYQAAFISLDEVGNPGYYDKYAGVWTSVYEETNDYYRKLAGLPNYEGDNIVYNTDPRWKVGVAVHKLDILSKAEMVSCGYIDELIAANPDSEYLKYIGVQKISIFTSRDKDRFGILYMDGADSDLFDVAFKEEYDRTCYLVNNVYWSKVFALNNDLYENFLAMCILFMTIQSMYYRYLLTDTTRDFFDVEALKVIYESYSVPFYSEIPLTYHRKIVKAMNRLVSYKGSANVFFDLFSIFDMGSMSLYSYYITKEHKLGDTGRPQFVIQKDEDGNEMYDDNGDPILDPIVFDVNFARVNILDDPALGVQDPSNAVMYHELTELDPYWIDDEDLQMKLKEEYFNYTETKYIGIQTVFDLMKITFENGHAFRLIMDNRKYTENLTIRWSELSITTDVFSVFIYLAATYCRYWGYQGEISSKIPAVMATIGYNFEECLTILNNDIMNDPVLSKDAFLIQSIRDIIVDETNQPDPALEKIEAVHYYIIGKYSDATTVEEYHAYRDLYRSLLVSKEVEAVFTDPDTGEIYPYFTDVLSDTSPALMQRYLYLPEGDLENEMTMIVYQVEEILPSLRYMPFSAGISTSSLMESLFKILSFFKSAKAELVDYRITYMITMRGINYMKWMDITHSLYQKWWLPPEYTTFVSIMEKYNEAVRFSHDYALQRDETDLEQNKYFITDYQIMQDWLVRAADIIHHNFSGQLYYVDYLRRMDENVKIRSNLMLRDAHNLDVLSDECFDFKHKDFIKDHYKYLCDKHGELRITVYTYSELLLIDKLHSAMIHYLEPHTSAFDNIDYLSHDWDRTYITDNAVLSDVLEMMAESVFMTSYNVMVDRWLDLRFHWEINENCGVVEVFEMLTEWYHMKSNLNIKEDLTQTFMHINLPSDTHIITTMIRNLSFIYDRVREDTGLLSILWANTAQHTMVSELLTLEDKHNVDIIKEEILGYKHEGLLKTFYDYLTDSLHPIRESTIIKDYLHLFTKLISAKESLMKIASNNILGDALFRRLSDISETTHAFEDISAKDVFDIISIIAFMSDDISMTDLAYKFEETSYSDEYFNIADVLTELAKTEYFSEMLIMRDVFEIGDYKYIINEINMLTDMVMLHAFSNLKIESDFTLTDEYKNFMVQYVIEDYMHIEDLMVSVQEIFYNMPESMMNLTDELVSESSLTNLGSDTFEMIDILKSIITNEHMRYSKIIEFVDLTRLLKFMGTTFTDNQELYTEIMSWSEVYIIEDYLKYNDKLISAIESFSKSDSLYTIDILIENIGASIIAETQPMTTTITDIEFNIKKCSDSFFRLVDTFIGTTTVYASDDNIHDDFDETRDLIQSDIKLESSYIDNINSHFTKWSLNRVPNIKVVKELKKIYDATKDYNTKIHDVLFGSTSTFGCYEYYHMYDKLVNIVAKEASMNSTTGFDSELISCIVKSISEHDELITSEYFDILSELTSGIFSNLNLTSKLYSQVSEYATKYTDLDMHADVLTEITKHLNISHYLLIRELFILVDSATKLKGSNIEFSSEMFEIGATLYAKSEFELTDELSVDVNSISMTKIEEKMIFEVDKLKSSIDDYVGVLRKSLLTISDRASSTIICTKIKSIYAMVDTIYEALSSRLIDTEMTATDKLVNTLNEAIIDDVYVLTDKLMSEVNDYYILAFNTFTDTLHSASIDYEMTPEYAILVDVLSQYINGGVIDEVISTIEKFENTDTFTQLKSYAENMKDVLNADNYTGVIIEILEAHDYVAPIENNGVVKYTNANHYDHLIEIGSEIFNVILDKIATSLTILNLDSNLVDGMIEYTRSKSLAKFIDVVSTSETFSGNSVAEYKSLITTTFIEWTKKDTTNFVTELIAGEVIGIIKEEVNFSTKLYTSMIINNYVTGSEMQLADIITEIISTFDINESIEFYEKIDSISEKFSDRTNWNVMKDVLNVDNYTVQIEEILKSREVLSVVGNSGGMIYVDARYHDTLIELGGSIFTGVLDMIATSLSKFTPNTKLVDSMIEFSKCKTEIMFKDVVNALDEFSGKSITEYKSLLKSTILKWSQSDFTNYMTELVSFEDSTLLTDNYKFNTKLYTAMIINKYNSDSQLQIADILTEKVSAIDIIEYLSMYEKLEHLRDSFYCETGVPSMKDTLHIDEYTVIIQEFLNTRESITPVDINGEVKYTDASYQDTLRDLGGLMFSIILDDISSALSKLTTNTNLVNGMIEFTKSTTDGRFEDWLKAIESFTGKTVSEYATLLYTSALNWSKSDFTEFTTELVSSSDITLTIDGITLDTKLFTSILVGKYSSNTVNKFGDIVSDIISAIDINEAVVFHEKLYLISEEYFGKDATRIVDDFRET